MLKSDFEALFKLFTNEYGFVSGPDLNKDHNPLFHGFYIDLLDYFGFLDTAERNKQAALMGTLIHRLYPGILRSAPWGKPNANEHSHDNVRAMLWISQKLGMTFAKDFLAHGRTHGWNWNENDPNTWELEGTYWRFAGMIVQARISAGERPGFLEKLVLDAEIYLAAKKKRQHSESMTLPYYMVKTMDPTDWVVRYWKKKAHAKYPDGLAGVFTDWGADWKSQRHPYADLYKGLINV